MILLHWDADDNARIATRLSVENRRHFDDLNGAAVATICMVVPTGVTVE